MNIFLIALTAFGLFTVLYAALASAIFYHLRQYTLPGHPAPRIVMAVFIFLSVLFWFFSLTFIFKLPS